MMTTDGLFPFSPFAHPYLRRSNDESDPDNSRTLASGNKILPEVVEEDGATGEFKVYPNPASNRATFIIR